MRLRPIDRTILDLMMEELIWHSLDGLSRAVRSAMTLDLYNKVGDRFLEGANQTRWGHLPLSSSLLSHVN